MPWTAIFRPTETPCCPWPSQTLVTFSQVEVSSNVTMYQDTYIWFTDFNELRLWDLRNKTEIRMPSQTQNHQDPITCAAWLAHQASGNEILCCGTGLGYLLPWKQCSTIASIEFKETLTRCIGAGHELLHHEPSICHRNSG